MRILVIDVGGTHVKVLATGRKESVRIASGGYLLWKDPHARRQG
jgi:hypothetical protein